MKLQKFDLKHKHREWWLRSAISDYNYYVGTVYYNGNVGHDDAYYRYGVLPACIII